MKYYLLDQFKDTRGNVFTLKLAKGIGDSYLKYPLVLVDRNGKIYSNYDNLEDANYWIKDNINRMLLEEVK